MAEGWEYRLWTNKSIVVFRSLDQFVLGGHSEYKGLGLEMSRSVKVYEDKEVFPVLKSINKSVYRESSSRGEFPEILPAHGKRFAPDLLTNYLLESVGEYNYAAKADNLRLAVLHEFGGVYIDTDTQLPGFLEERQQANGRKIFSSLNSHYGVLFSTGWCSTTGCNNDLIAAIKGAPQIKHLLLDQYLHCNMLKNQIYTVSRRREVNDVADNPDPSIFWKRCAVKRSPKRKRGGLQIKPYKGMYPDASLAESCITLDDMKRYRGDAMYKRIYGSYPVNQIGYDLVCKNSPGFFNEDVNLLRHSLTLHTTGPLSLCRLLDDQYITLNTRNWNQLFFRNQTNSGGHEEYGERGFLLSQTVWGNLKRWAAGSWDQPVLDKSFAHEDYSAMEALIGSGLQCEASCLRERQENKKQKKRRHHLS